MDQLKKVNLVIMKGLPASGKTTWSLQKLEEKNWKRVSKDDLRKMMDNGKFSRSNEKLIVLMERNIVDKLIGEGCNVIVDDTNLNMDHINYFNSKYGSSPNVTITVQDFTNIPPEVCIERDAARTCPIGSKVIHRLWMTYIRKPTPLKFDPSLPIACICDIDGTIAESIGRNIYEFDKVINDIKTMHSYLIESVPFEIIFVSGRDESSRTQTTEWIKINLPNIKWQHLYMRNTGDSRDDVEVKNEIWLNSISGKYNIAGVFDDRPKVVRLWKSLGLPVFSVGPFYEF